MPQRSHLRPRARTLSKLLQYTSEFNRHGGAPQERLTRQMGLVSGLHRAGEVHRIGPRPKPANHARPTPKPVAAPPSLSIGILCTGTHHNRRRAPNSKGRRQPSSDAPSAPTPGLPSRLIAPTADNSEQPLIGSRDMKHPWVERWRVRLKHASIALQTKRRRLRENSGQVTSVERQTGCMLRTNCSSAACSGCQTVEPHRQRHAPHSKLGPIVQLTPNPPPRRNGSRADAVQRRLTS